MSQERRERIGIPWSKVQNTDNNPLVILPEILQSWGCGVSIDRKDEYAVVYYESLSARKLLNYISDTNEIKALTSVSIGLSEPLIDVYLKDCKWNDLTKDRVRALCVQQKIELWQERAKSKDVYTARLSSQEAKKNRKKLQEQFLNIGISPLISDEIRSLVEKVAKRELETIPTLTGGRCRY